MISGILFHGLYLGGVFYSISKGFPVGITALIVCLQPILTAILARPLLNEVVTWRQWIGIILGFLGTLIVLGFDGGKELPVVGIAASFIALAAVTAGTLWQKTLSEDLPLSVSNTYQAFSASCFHLIVALALGNWFINLTLGFVLSMGWQILSREDIDPALLEKEREVARGQAEGKPAQAVEKIVEGKVNKYLSENCLLEQAYVKDPDQTVQQILTTMIAKMGENMMVKRFARFQIGA